MFYRISSMFLFLSVGFVLAGAGDPANSKDKVLIKKVSEAVKKKVPLDKVESFVGRKATINTSRKSDADAWSLTNIALDQKKSQIDSFRDTLHIVYWVYESTSSKRIEPSVAGIAWTKKNEMKLFFGTVSDP